MKKRLVFLVACLVICLVFAPSIWSRSKTIKIGINAPMTGDIPKVGEGSKFAGQMWLEDINKAGGLKVGKKKYKVELVIEDNESKAESAVKVNTKLITEDEVLAIVGPQSSKQAVPAGGVADNYKTPMVSPWSTNPNTTKDRPYVFRGCFLDPFQGPVLANFIKDEFGFSKAAVLYDVASDYPKGLAEFFKHPGDPRQPRAGRSDGLVHQWFSTFSGWTISILRSTRYGALASRQAATWADFECAVSASRVSHFSTNTSRSGFAMSR